MSTDNFVHGTQFDSKCVCTTSQGQPTDSSNCSLHKERTEIKQVLYAVIKYDGKYYAPYLKAEHLDFHDLNNMLTSDRRVALRFPNKEVAQYFADEDTKTRQYYDYNGSFDPKKVRVVAVVKKVLV